MDKDKLRFARPQDRAKAAHAAQQVPFCPEVPHEDELFERYTAPRDPLSNF